MLFVDTCELVMDICVFHWPSTDLRTQTHYQLLKQQGIQNLDACNITFKVFSIENYPVNKWTDIKSAPDPAINPQLS